MPTSTATRQIIVFSDDWGVHPSSCQHIFKNIVADHDVIWVNTVGMRLPRPTFGDLRKIVTKVQRMITSQRRLAQATQKQPLVLQPFMLPFMSVNWCRGINRILVRRALGRVIDRSSSRLPIIVTTVPNACDYVDLTPSERIVYYCVDDFSEWPGLDRGLILEMEGQLLEKVDVILVTSEGLQTRLKKTGKPVSLLEHGVDAAHFSFDPSIEHGALSGIDKPRVGFFGLIDGRMDQKLLLAVAKCLPGIQFILAGPSEIPMSDLTNSKNITWIGKIPYAELPKLITGLSALFIPYKVNELAKALSPLKLKEYLATGKPVVSSAIPAANAFSAFVDIAGSETEWVELIGNAVSPLQGNVGKRQRLDLSAESWSAKAKVLLAACFETDDQGRLVNRRPNGSR